MPYTGTRMEACAPKVVESRHERRKLGFKEFKILQITGGDYKARAATAGQTPRGKVEFFEKFLRGKG